VEQIPEKVFYKIGEVCQYTDTQPYVLRFWESEFPQLAPNKTRSGQRIYTRQDIDLVLRIKKLLYEEEYTIAGARKRLEQESDSGGGTSGTGRPSPGTGRRRPGQRAEPAAKDEGAHHPRRLPDPAARGGEARTEALEEIETLKGRMTVLEARLAEAEAALGAAKREGEAWRGRATKAAERLEAILAEIDAE
jgi:DNA-binding transcriptional MerR regulator